MKKLSSMMCRAKILRYLHIMFVLVGVIASAVMVNAQQTTCGGALPSRMRVGFEGRITAPNGANLRASPSVAASLVGGIPQDAVFMVLDGPVCADGFAWWEVRYRRFTGWAAESNTTDYWMVSLAPDLQRLALDDVSLLLDKSIARSGTPERKPRTPVYQDGAFALVDVPHLRFSLTDDTGQAHVSVFPAADFNRLVGGALDPLAALIETRPDTLDMFALPPTLPAIDMQRILIAQPQFINFDGGEGLRFIGYFDYTADAITARDIYYVYVGLTDDRQRYVQAFIPVRANFLPPAPDFSTTSYTQYLAQTQVMLDAAEANTFTPTLATLDKLIDSLTVSGQAPAPSSFAQQGAVRFTVGSLVSSGAIGETITQTDPTAALPFPPHTRFYLDGLPTFGGAPHVAVYPAQAFNFTFVGALDSLTRALDSGDSPPQAPQRLPILDAGTRRLDAQALTLNFRGGQGIRYVAVYGAASDAITAYDAVYVFVGLTNDTRTYIQVVVPLVSTVLPTTPPADFDAASLLADEALLTEYLAQARRDLNAASSQSFAPRLDALDALVQSLTLGE